LILLISVGGGGALPTGGPPVTLFAYGKYKNIKNRSKICG